MTDKTTDPYHHLLWAVGDADDFVCFDYDYDRESDLVTLHSVLNSETGSFIQDFDAPEVYEAETAIAVATQMVDAAIEWCAENDVEHDDAGWNQDEFYFARCVKAAVKGEPSPDRITYDK